MPLENRDVAYVEYPVLLYVAFSSGYPRWSSAVTGSRSASVSVSAL